MAIHFIYVIMASLVQVGWLYNMKRVNKENWLHIKKLQLFKFSFWKNFFPIILYIFLSVSSIIFLTKAMEKIPTAVTYAVWSGLVIVISALIDQFILKEKTKILKYIYICMIVGGIVGLRLMGSEE